MLPLTVTGLLALSACQLVGQDDAASDKAGRLNTLTASPLHAYMVDSSSDEVKIVNSAEWILAKKCMLRLGFEGFVAFNPKTVESTYSVRQGDVSSRDTTDDDKPYGVDDPDLAAEHGYRGDGKSAEQSSQPQEWPTDQYLALTGEFDKGESHRAHGHPIPEHGCLGEAGRQLVGPEPKATKVNGVTVPGFALPYQLWYESRKEGEKDPAWKKADHAWSECMKDEGFRYDSPFDAMVDSAWIVPDRPSAKEKKAAAADARCKLDTDYIDTVHKVQTRVQKSLISKNKKGLDALRAMQTRAVKNAQAIVAKDAKDAKDAKES
ncbi:hypothetical protein [Streptomyces sp. NPDC086787]|uniref:hypothetical protein n=1 Tax=Streptomyces sp. NPDC086787 TaxID=3365759 RepID=UPI0038207B2C